MRGLRPSPAGPPARLGDLSAVLALPADLHIALTPDNHGDAEGVLEGLLPPLGVVIHQPLLEIEAPLFKPGPGLIGGGSAAQGVKDDFGHKAPTLIILPPVGGGKETCLADKGPPILN